MDNVIKLLFVDDEKQMLSALSRIFRGSGFQVFKANSGPQALEILAQEEIHVLVSDMRMPEMDGAQLLSQTYELYPHTRRILLTGYSDQDSTIRAINHGQIHQYVSKPWDNDKLKEMIVQEGSIYFTELAQDNHNQKLSEQVQQVSAELAHASSFVDMAKEELLNQFNTTIKVISHLTNLRTPGRDSISNQVVSHSEALAKLIKLDKAVIAEISHAARLYQLGKLSLPDELLHTAINDMDASQKTQYKQHCLIGAQVLTPIKGLDYCAKIIEQSQEYVDGSGPLGLQGNSICLGARILHLVNDFQMLTHGHFFSEELSPLDALGYLKKHGGKKYDETLCKLYEKFIHELQKNQTQTQDTMLGVDDLLAGQILNRDLMSDKGVLLMAKGSTLDNQTIQKLKLITQEQNAEINVFVKIQDPQPAKTA